MNILLQIAGVCTVLGIASILWLLIEPVRLARKIAHKAKEVAAVLLETVTGRSCEKCDHYAKGSCWHPDLDTRDDCMTRLWPKGYKKREPARIEPLELTPEEEHQLRKIKDVLQEAGDTARESGLLEGQE